MGAVLRYTGARAALFGAVLGVLYVVGARQILLFGLAIVVSGLISYPLLSGQRDDMSRVLSERIGELKERVETGAAAEDAAADQAAASERDRGKPDRGGPDRGQAVPDNARTER